MKLALLFCAPSALAATIYFAGDSTMSHGGTGSGTAGWADYIAQYTSAEVSNKAIAGRSARSYTREGHFEEIAATMEEGDYVVMEFGHNDGGSLVNDNGRTACPGSGNETCQTVYNGQPETVLTFPAYLKNAANMFLDQGAGVLISSQTPNNPWETGTFSYTPSRFVGYADLAASRAGVDYVDHGAYVASIFKALGEEKVGAFFPLDHTHTSPEGAAVVAEAFLKAVVCKGIALEDVLTTMDFDGECL